ncbi:MAG: NAD(P)-dependent glycerol-3-phosphate dehydrogenase [Planctomycetes bacterium]|nr:NAD(P)-dependent glycerol-3-phosphate dehydrogenase [Planctomycetota bacterium]
MSKSGSTRRVGVIGDGGMGTLCACLLAEGGAEVILWSAFADHAARLAADRENRQFLPGVPLPEGVRPTADAADLPRDPVFLVSAVPTPYLRAVMQRLKSRLPDAPIVSVSKGIENETLQRPSEVIGDVLPQRTVAVLSGPCIAFEVARRMPATVVVAAEDQALAETVQEAMGNPYFRVYYNSDVLGVELGGPLKNVIALAAGICDGLEIGVNAKAALLTRGLAEMTRLGVALGARRETFAGLAGVGDLITTCVSAHGRNRTVGERIGRGQSLDQVLEGMNEQVAEGVPTTRSVVALAARCGVEMPITGQVYEVLFSGKSPRQAIHDLMTRPWRSEEEAF